MMNTGQAAGSWVRSRLRNGKGLVMDLKAILNRDTMPAGLQCCGCSGRARYRRAMSKQSFQVK